MSLLLEFLLVVAVILLASLYFGSWAVKIGQPAVFGQILAGLILGPTFLNMLSWPLFTQPQSATAVAATLESMPPVFTPIKLTAELGVIMLMFLAGLETDLSQLRRVGATAFWAAIGGVTAPFVFGVIVALIFLRLGLPFTTYEVIFIGTILTATSVSISAQTLMELGALRSKEGTAIIGAAVVDDVLGLILLSLVIAFKPKVLGSSVESGRLLDFLVEWITLNPTLAGYTGFIRVVLLFVLMGVFVLLCYVVYKYLLIPVFSNMSKQAVSESTLVTAIIFALAFAFLAEFIGNLAAITGSYICGVMLAQTPFRHDVTEKTLTVTYGFFVSIFFVSIGMEANVREIFAPILHLASMTPQEVLAISFALIILAVAVLTKVLGCFFGAWGTGFNWLESYRVGVGMISRGEVGLIVASIGYSAGIIQLEVFSTMILMVLVTTLITPIWLRFIFPRRPIQTVSDTGL